MVWYWWTAIGSVVVGLIVVTKGQIIMGLLEMVGELIGGILSS